MPPADAIRSSSALAESITSTSTFVEIESYESLRGKIETREKAALKLAWALRDRDAKVHQVESDL